MIHLANTTAPHAPRQKQSVLDLYRSQNMSQHKPPHTQQITQQVAHPPLPAPEPNPEPRPLPDGVTAGSDTYHAVISPVDWDELFHAVQERLEHSVDDTLHKASESAPDARRTVTKTEVLDCVTAMKQLHKSLTLERRQSQALHAG